MQKTKRGLRKGFRQLWRWLLVLRERVSIREDALHLLLAGGVGVIGGLVNFGFLKANNAIQKWILGESGDLIEVAEDLNLYYRLFTPAVGGLLAGLILYFGLRLVRRRKTSNLLEVVVAGDGRLSFRNALTNTLSSLMSISSGASIGREGSITAMTATLSSKVGQWANWQPYRLRLLVACGASAGMAAAYNAPVAASVFAAQIVLGNFSMYLFGPLLLSSVVATMLSRTFFGIAPWYEVPVYDFTSVTQLPWFILLGILAGMVGALFLKLLLWSESAFSKVPFPLYGRLALGGLLVGIIAIYFPEVWGNGYGAANRVLLESFHVEFLLGLFLAKLLATGITAGCGTVGGIFTPTLFLGACLGSAVGTMLHQANYAEALPTGVFALVGMASVLSATVHSPLLAMIMVFEISLNYSLMPALMVACAVSTIIGKSLHSESVYTEPLRKKGVRVETESARIGAATQQTVGDVMREPIPPIQLTDTFEIISDRFLTSSNNHLPVVDDYGQLRGVIVLHDLKEYLHAGQELSGVIAYDIMKPTPVTLTPNQKLLDCLPTILATDVRNIPVVNNQKEQRLIGAVVRSEVLSQLSETFAISSSAST